MLPTRAEVLARPKNRRCEILRNESKPSARILRAARFLMLSGLFLGGCAIVPQEQPPHAESQEGAAVPELPPSPGPQTFDVNPEILSMSPPVYPEAAREAGQEGTVFCDLLVDTHGAVREVRVALGVSPELDDAAVTAVRTALFKPALKDAVPVQCWMRMPIEFNLHK